MTDTNSLCNLIKKDDKNTVMRELFKKQAVLSANAKNDYERKQCEMKQSKTVLAICMILFLLLVATIPVFAEDLSIPAQENYIIYVNGTALELTDLPRMPYAEEDTIMVPLRKIGEALGYTVGWNASTGEITIDDCYIQNATLLDQSATVMFKGHLKVIDMSREIENPVPTVIYDGYTYVPVSFFAEFFNDVTINENIISITPSTCELA